MKLDFAIVADDLTGALDTSIPFALCGRRVAAAVRPEALGAALLSGAEVVVVSTASRALPAGEAARIVGLVAETIRLANPRTVLKKIDSRLKGNVASEVAALAAGLGLARVVVAPAIPDQQRLTIDGAVVGRGVPTPIAIAPLFADGPAIAVANAANDADLDHVVAHTDWNTTLAVGARGLGAAFARRLGSTLPRHFARQNDTLFAIGSRDQITAQQIAALRAAHPDLTVLEAPDGEVRGTLERLPALVVCTGSFDAPDEAVSRRFAAGLAPLIAAARPGTLVTAGGDTALAILDALGVELVFPQGEAALGLPWFLITPENGHSIRCVVKSGGFGAVDVLASLLPGSGSAGTVAPRLRGADGRIQ